MPAGHTDHAFHEMQLVGRLPQPREMPGIMIRATEPQRDLFQENAQEPVQFAQMIGQQAIMHAAPPGA